MGGEVNKRSERKFNLHRDGYFRKLLLKLKREPLKTDPVDRMNQIANKFFGYRFDCRYPKTFNEYTCWLKYFYRNKEWERCADKLGSKEFLIEHGYEKYVIKTLGIYKNSSEIDLSKLPDRFVLKTNHDSGSVYICDKKETNFEEVFKELDESLQHVYSESNDEWVYQNTKPVIFAEEIIQPRVGNKIIDYKFFGFNGKFGWGFTGQNRLKDARFTVFEDDFKHPKVEYIHINPEKEDYPPKPDSFDEMVKVTEEISKILDFVRVDFYDTTEGPKIGELTFFSHSGLGIFTRKKYDYKYGEFFKNTKIYEEVLKKINEGYNK